MHETPPMMPEDKWPGRMETQRNDTTFKYKGEAKNPGPVRIAQYDPAEPDDNHHNGGEKATLKEQSRAVDNMNIQMAGEPNAPHTTLWLRAKQQHKTRYRPCK